MASRATAKRKSEIEQLKADVDQLRRAGQQLMMGLTVYARQENWADNLWTGPGKGPDTARKYLGLSEVEEPHDHPPPLDHP